jgi:hypothetical protein
MKTKPGLMIAMMMAMAALVASACDDEETCEWDGQTYDVGETFPAGDGCNSCHCNEDGEVTCTLLACPLP